MARTWRDFNFVLLGCVIVLTCFSLAMIYSILSPSYISRHLVNMVLGVVALVLLTALDYHAFQAWARPLYLGGVVVLAAVLVLGSVSGGAQSWIDFGFRVFQPSEPAKLLIIVALAAYWSRFENGGGSWRVQAGGLLLTAVPTAMVFVQPDFGTTLGFVMVWAAMAWTSGIRWWQIGALLLAAALLGVFAWFNVLEDYQKLRVLQFIDPAGSDPTQQNGLWDVRQALGALRGGGMTGVGLGQGPITQGDYVAAIYTDYIFAATGEELGFIGAAAVLLFECILLWQALVIAQTARDTFGRMIAVGVMALFFCHLLVNVGMNLQIMPVTGIPLPFVSYGGSFTLTSLAAIGLLESVALRRRKIVF